MKPLLFALCFVFACGGLSARQTPTWQPSPGHTQVPIWPGTPPDAQPVAGPEESHWWPAGPAGPPGGFTVYHVTQPTMTVYSPTGNNTGVAVVVFPGGGYEDLAIDLEGTEVCDWLTPKGITCVLLKYRVPGEEYYPKSAPYPKSGPYPESPMALEDAQRTLRLACFHAAEWHIDPHKIGVVGFSAGGHLSAAMSNHFAKRLYPAVDAADKESCRPDFEPPGSKTRFSCCSQGSSYLVLRCFLPGRCLVLRCVVSGVFAGATEGRSELKVSAIIFQVPSDCFFQIAMSLPWSATGLPFGPSRANW